MMEEYQLLDRLLQFAHKQKGWAYTVEFFEKNPDIEISHETLVYLLTKLRVEGYAHVTKQTDNEFGYYLQEAGQVFIVEGGYSKREEDRLKKEKYEYEKYFLEVEALKKKISHIHFNKVVTICSIVISLISLFISIFI